MGKVSLLARDKGQPSRARPLAVEMQQVEREIHQHARRISMPLQGREACPPCGATPPTPARTWKIRSRGAGQSQSGVGKGRRVLCPRSRAATARQATAIRPSERVRWVAAEDGDGAGIRHFVIRCVRPGTPDRSEDDQRRCQHAFFLSRNEYETAAARAETWRLYRVHLFAQTPRIFTISPPLLTSVHLRTESWRASFS